MTPKGRAGALLALLPLFAGCFGREAKRAPDFAGVQRRAAQAAAQPEKLETAPEPLEHKAKILKKTAACTWVESVGRVVIGENDTRHQARAAAQDEARKNAMQDLLGVEVKSRLLDFQQEGFKDDVNLIESVLQTTRSGRILEESVVSEGFKNVGDCRDCRYELVLHSCIAEAQARDKDFRVELGLSRSRFIHGDEARLSVTATRDCYLYLYDVSTDGQTALIAPNDSMPEIKLKAGQTFDYPDEELRRSGLKLVAELPQGREVSAETIRVIASRAPLPRQLGDPAFGGYLGILRRLHGSRYDWSDDAAAFTIYKR